MSEELFHFLWEAVWRVRAKEDPRLDEIMVRTVVELHVGHYAPAPMTKGFTWPFTLPPGSEQLLHNAFGLGASYLVTNDGYLLGNKPSRRFRAPDGREVIAARLEFFVETELEDVDFSLRDIHLPGDLKLRIVPPSRPQTLPAREAPAPVRGRFWRKVRDLGQQ